MDDYFPILGILIIYLPIISLVLFGVYMIVDRVTDKITNRQLAAQKAKQAETILPLRLQAYERMCLFLERITPSNLLLRIAPSALVSLELQQTLLNEIREEYNHNIAQQLYVSAEVWNEIYTAMNEVVSVINQASAELQPEEPATHLAKKIFSKVIEMPTQPTVKALEILKTEFTRL